MICQSDATKGKWAGGSLAVASSGRFVQTIGVVVVSVFPIIDLISWVRTYIDKNTEIKDCAL